jgi:hypothetical protein
MRFLPSFGWRTAVATVPVLAVVGALVPACGPSFQALYEGDARFEHCYALEERGSVPMQDKSDCWRDWTMRYTYGQTRDRVEYAAARYRALSRAPQAPTDEAMMEAAPGEGRGTSIAAPAPTSAFAPPPKTLTDTDGGALDKPNALPGYADGGATVLTPAAATPSDARPPSSDCGDTCMTSWNGCKDKCRGTKACDACAAFYKKCMKACFAK